MQPRLVLSALVLMAAVPALAEPYYVEGPQDDEDGFIAAGDFDYLINPLPIAVNHTGLWASNIRIGTFENAAEATLVGGNNGAVFQEMTIQSLINSGLLDGQLSGATGLTLQGINTDDADGSSVTNSATGIIRGGANGAWVSGNLGTFRNAGLIEGGDTGMVVINAGVPDEEDGGIDGLINGEQGTITGGHYGLFISHSRLGALVNHGTIAGGAVGLMLDQSRIGAFLNAGRVASSDGTGLFVRGDAPLIDNTGTIEGVVGIQFSAHSPGGGMVRNAGIIRSMNADGTAIDFDHVEDPEAEQFDRDDVLTLLAGSSITGALRFGRGKDQLDISGFSGSAVLDVYDLEELVRGDRIVRFPAGGLRQLTLPEPPLEPEEEEPPPSDPQPEDPPPPDPDPQQEPPPQQPPGTGTGTGTGTGGGTTLVVVSPDLFAGANVGAGQMALVHGLNTFLDSRAWSAPPASGFSHAAAPVPSGATAVLSELDTRPAAARLWGDVFGSRSAGAASTNVGGVAAGIDGAVGARLLLGGVASYAAGATRLAGGQTITTQTGAFGLYGDYDAGVLAIDFSLLAGLQSHQSARLISTPGGTETARASFTGAFIAPALSVTLPLYEDGRTSVAARAGATYVAGTTGSYAETGSSMNLGVGERRISTFDGRLGLEAAQAGVPGVSGTLRARAGVLAQVNGGSASVPVTLLGETSAAQTPGSTVLGAYAGAGVEADLGAAVLAVNADGSLRTDGIGTLALRAGLRGAL